MCVRAEGSLRRRPKDAEALVSRGLAYFRSKAFDKAYSDFDAALDINPKLASALYGRGLALQMKESDPFQRLLDRKQRGGLPVGEEDIAAAKAIKPDIAEEFARYGAE